MTTTHEPTEIARAIHQRLARGYENPECLEGVVQFRFSDVGAGFHVAFGRETLDLGLGESPMATAFIEMALETGQSVATGPNLDLASEKNWELIRTDGDVRLIGALAQMTKIPRADAAELFRLSEENARRNPVVTEVARLSRPSPSLVAELLAAGQPMLVSDVIPTHWPRFRELTFRMLEEQYGDVAVRTTNGSMAIRDVVRAAFSARDDEAPYTFGAPAPTELLHMFPPPPYLVAERYGPAQIWLGSSPGAVSTPLHRDSAPAFLGQIQGVKEWIIISPDQSELTYARKSYNRDQPCWVDAWAPNYDYYPKYRQVRALRFELAPGQMTIIPPGWFHTVKSHHVTFSIGFHYDPVADFGYVLR